MGAMEWNVQMLNTLLSEHTTQSQYQLMEIFNSLINSSTGWKECTVLLINETHSLVGQAVFYFLRVVEQFVTTRYESSSNEDREWLRKFFASWLDRSLQQPSFVRNKTAQLLALCFLCDCPNGQWNSFFDDLINFTSAYGGDHPMALDMVLRVMKALDAEVADREISFTAERAERNTIVKDWMRDHAVENLAAWWLHVINLFKDRPEQANLVCLCLEVVSLYVSWVEISLVANEAYMEIFLYLLQPQPGLCREAVCDCLAAVVTKGMPPASKVHLVQMISEQLSRAGVFDVIGVLGNGLGAVGSSTDDVEYLAKLSGLINQMGIQVLDAYNSFMKARAQTEALAALNIFENKVDLSLNLLAFKDEEVSRNVAPLMQNYLSLLKPMAQQGLSDATKVRIETILRTIIKNLKYEDSYDFSNEGEEEAIFQDYRKTIRVLMTNLTQLAPDLVLQQVQQVLKITLSQWQTTKWNEVELAITLFYQLGEALPVQVMSLAASCPDRVGAFSPPGSSRKRAPPCAAHVAQSEALKQMLVLLCQSGVLGHNHTAVVQQYFETIARYERVFFALDKGLLRNAVMDFLSEAGLKSSNERTRLRCAYLFSRFLRTHKFILEDPAFAEAILLKLQPLLTLPQMPERLCATSPSHSLDSDSGDNGSSGSSVDHFATAGDPQQQQQQQHQLSEQGYLFETTSFIIVGCSAIPIGRKAELVTAMLAPIVTQVPKLGARIAVEAHKGSRGSAKLPLLLAESVRTCIDYACRSSKAFTSTATMEQCGCVSTFAQTLDIFIQALAEIPLHLTEVRALVGAGLRVYLHRMVVCLGDQILQHFGPAARELLRTASGRDLTDFLPLLNQIMIKYKQRVQDTIQELMGGIITRVLSSLDSGAPTSNTASAALPQPVGPDLQAAEEQRRLRRAFFGFFGTALQNQLTEAFLLQPREVQERMLGALVSGAMDAGDPQAQKAAFGALRQLVVAMPGSEVFRTFVLQQVIPACLVAPARPDFDLQDAQTVLALNECAACLKAALDKLGDTMLRYLSSEALPNLSFPPPIANEYLQALRHWSLKEFQQYLKKFYADATRPSNPQSCLQATADGTLGRS